MKRHMGIFRMLSLNVQSWTHCSDLRSGELRRLCRKVEAARGQ